MPRKHKLSVSRTRKYEIQVRADKRKTIDVHHLIAALRTIFQPEQIASQAKKSKT
jgi:hypothetical protein